MTDLVPLNAEALTMDSLEISEVVESHHDDVKRSMERLAAKGTITLPPLAEVPNRRSGPKTISVYRVNKRDSYVVVAQLSPEFTARLVDRWQELEGRVVAGELPNFSNPADAARAWADQYEQRQIAEAQRDEAVRTKAMIGTKREATAMAKASAATRKVNQLTRELGFNAQQATVIAVEKKLNRKFGKQDWRPLREYCNTNGLHAEKVHDPRWGEATAWPAAAWQAVYGVDLAELFPEVTLEPA